MTVKVRPLPNGKMRVDIRFRWPDESVFRERPNVGGMTLAQARKWGERREAELRDAGKAAHEAATAAATPALTFGDFVKDRWWPVYPPSKGNAHTTIKEKRIHLDAHLLPHFGGLPMTDATFAKEALDSFAATMAAKTVGKVKRKPLSAKRINNVMATLGRILASAHEWGALATLPRMPKRKVDEPAWDYFNGEETRLAVAATRSAEERALLLFAFRTGARAGEQLAFLWEDLDWHARQVIFRRSSSDGVVVERTKSKRIRRVPMGPALEAALKAIKHLRGPLVFCQEDGAPLTLDMLHERLWGACRRAGLRRIKWHETRHSYASQLVMLGTPLRQVQEWLGHSTIQMTMRYAHLAPGGGREYVAALDRSPSLGATGTS